MPPKNGLGLQQKQKVQNYQVLQGRLTAAKWISMSEPEVGREILDLESNPLFQDLMYGDPGMNPVFQRKRWPASSIHSGFYELKDEISAGGGSGDILDILEKSKDLVEIIQKIGVEHFERFFLYGEDGTSLDDVCEKVNISKAEGQKILNLVLEVGTRSEFFRPALTPETSGIRYHCIAAIEKDPRDPENLFFRFMTPYWARGKYVVQYDRLEDWKKDKKLDMSTRRELRGLLKRVELLNMRQDTLFQILSRATNEQSSYLRSRQGSRRRPLSLRELSRRLGVAPSTVSRAVSNRSVQLPWGEEVPLKSLLTGQRIVILSIMTDWLSEGRMGKGITDEVLMQRLAQESGITVSRRTVNECRRKLLGEK